jgi:hypothetical protein
MTEYFLSLKLLDRKAFCDQSLALYYKNFTVVIYGFS